MMTDQVIRGIHVFYEPEPSDGRWPETMVYSRYLGVLQAVGDTVRTGNAVKAQGDEMPCNSDVWARFSAGKPASFSEDLQLVYPRGSMRRWRGALQILSIVDKVVLFQTLGGRGTFIDDVPGMYLRCGPGPRRLVESAALEYGSLEYGDGYYVLTLDSMVGVTNDYTAIGEYAHVTIGEYIGLWEERAWWEDEWAAIAAGGVAGRLKIVQADYDAESNVLSNELIPREYEALLAGAAIVEPYGGLPGLGYRLSIKKTPIVTGYTGDAPMNVKASDREYNDKIVVTWDDVPLADRLQVYVRTTDTEPSGAELKDEQSPFSVPNVVVESVHDELYCIEVQGGAYQYDGEYYTGLGLVLANGENNDPEYAGLLPDDGTTALKATYTRNRHTSGVDTADETALHALLVAGRRLYIWVRARIDRDGVAGEWTDLSDMATGLIRNL